MGKTKIVSGGKTGMKKFVKKMSAKTGLKK